MWRFADLPQPEIHAALSTAFEDINLDLKSRPQPVACHSPSLYHHFTTRQNQTLHNPKYFKTQSISLFSLIVSESNFLQTLRCAEMNLNRNDAATQPLSNSIPNDLEDAAGKLRLCKPVIHKGQMFLSTGRRPLTPNGGHPPEVTVPPSTLGCGGRTTAQNVVTRGWTRRGLPLAPSQYSNFPC